MKKSRYNRVAYVALFCAKAGCETVAMYVNNGIY